MWIDIIVSLSLTFELSTRKYYFYNFYYFIIFYFIILFFNIYYFIIFISFISVCCWPLTCQHIHLLFYYFIIFFLFLFIILLFLFQFVAEFWPVYTYTYYFIILIIYYFIIFLIIFGHLLFSRLWFSDRKWIYTHGNVHFLYCCLTKLLVNCRPLTCQHVNIYFIIYYFNILLISSIVDLYNCQSIADLWAVNT